jgi:CDP-4-dehydro-6-deoxyglucose reductase
MHGDFHFSEQEKAQGYVMLCTTHAESDLVIQADEAHSTQDIPQQQIKVKVAKLELRNDKVGILHLRTPRTNTFRFLAGQHAELQWGDLPPFDAAIASCPCNGMHLYFHLHRDMQHPFAQQVFEGLRIGTELELSGPHGDLSLDEDSRRPLLMIALGTDFAVIKSLIEHALNLEIGQPIRLFWLADAATGHYLDNYCRAWKDALDNFAFSEITLAAALPNANEMAEILPQLTTALPELRAADIYLAGPDSFTTSFASALQQKGADPSRMFVFHRRLAIRP